MRLHIRLIAAVAALTAVLGVGVAPAAAEDWDDGYRGWRDRPAWGDDDGERRSWGRREGWGRDGWDDAAAAALGGFALGTVAGAVAQPRYDGCWFTRRPVVDGWGNLVGYRNAEVCE